MIKVHLAIWNLLKNKHMLTPTLGDFKNIAIIFYNKWNFPKCVGSVDRKHIRMKCLNNSESMIHNYK